jgi:hypothetical protein
MRDKKVDEKEIKKLGILLEHWIEHNEEHAEEFREWAGKAKEYGSGKVSRKIAEASDYMVKASESLQDAIKLFNKEK